MPSCGWTSPYFLSLQACRYPEQFQRRLDLGRYLAIGIKDCANVGDAADLNRCLRKKGLLPGLEFTATEFKRLSETPEQELERQLDDLLMSHGYEAFYNPELVLRGALPVAEHLLGFEWTLLRAPQPSFILSDRPVPNKFQGQFALGISATLAIRFSDSLRPVGDAPIPEAPAQPGEIDKINAEVRGRAREWICGPNNLVHRL